KKRTGGSLFHFKTWGSPGGDHVPFTGGSSRERIWPVGDARVYICWRDRCAGAAPAQSADLAVGPTQGHPAGGHGNGGKSAISQRSIASPAKSMTSWYSTYDLRFTIYDLRARRPARELLWPDRKSVV